MNFATRALFPLLASISLNDGEGGGSGGGGGEGGGEGTGEGGAGTGDGSGAGSSDGDKAKPPPAGDDAAKKAAAEATAALAKSYEGWKPKLPEGLPFDEKGFDVYRKAALEAGLKPDAFQKLVDVFAGGEMARLKSVAEGLKAERTGWDKAVRADKELSGEDGKQLDATAALGRKAMQKFATPALRELLKSSGLEAHPEMLRLMARVGKGLAEDTTSTARSDGAGKRELTPKQKLKARYDHPTSAELHTDS